jgi:hypothetical protein
MQDLTSPRLIKLKGALFLALGLLSSILLLAGAPSWRNAFLLVIAIWSFARCYYFCFYVLERYVDPSFRFSGLGSAVRYLFGMNTSSETPVPTRPESKAP